MPADHDRGATREVFFRAWRHYREARPLEGAEKLVVQVALEHPEYHALLANPERYHDADYTPEMGRTNPFLHMGMHIAIEEQLALDAPRGVRELYARLQRMGSNPHEIQHRMMECLGEMLWQAARHGSAPDESRYLDCLRRLAGTPAQ